MKIDLEIPDWAEDQCIRVISGIETVAFKHVGKKWQVKEVRCNRCGFCCYDRACEHFDTTPGQEHCKLGLSMPFHCVVEVHKENYPKCVMTYKTVE